MNKGNEMETVYTNPTDAAKAIRLELKANFPGIKFRVKTHKYSGGDSINIYWVLGPTGAAVDKIVKKYEYGRFDGMTDYAYTEDTLVSCPDGSIKCLGGSKYVFTNREYAETWEGEEPFKELIARDLCSLIGIEFVNMGTNITGRKEFDNHCSMHTVVGLILSHTDLTKGYKGIRRTETKCSGSFADFYEIIPER